MSPKSGFASAKRPLTTELAVVTAGLVVLFLWSRFVGLAAAWAAVESVPTVGWIPVGVAFAGGLFVLGVVAFAGAFAAVRGVDPGLSLPSRADLRFVGLAVVVPVVLVGVTELVGLRTGVPYSSLTMTYYPDPAAPSALALVGVGTAVAVPCLAATCQVLVQGSLARAFDGGSESERVVLATTLVAAFATLSTTGGLTTVPERGKLAGAAAFVVALTALRYAADAADRPRVRSLATLTATLFAAALLLPGVAGVESLAAGLFAFAHLAVLGVAAYTYERTGSLFVPALAYLSVSLANAAVVLVVEAGGTPF